MTWQLVTLIGVLASCVTLVVAVWRLTRDAVSARDLNIALNQIDVDIKALNQTISPILRGRGNPLG